MKIFSIRDQKAEAFENIFLQNTNGQAERYFTSLVNDPKTLIAMYPADYDLYFIGDYDQQTGKIKPCETPQHLISAVQLKGSLQ